MSQPIKHSSRRACGCVTRVILTLALFSGGLAAAHKIKCFAAADGDVVAGYAWLAGGARPRDVPFRVYDPEGKLLFEGTTDSQGEFSFTPTRSCDHRVEVEAGPGHLAQFLVKAADLPAGLGPVDNSSSPSTAKAQSSMAGEVDPAETSETKTSPAVGPDWDVLISRAVSREIAPLRRELAEFKEKRRWQDIIAGVGYLVGLAGVAGFFLSRRISAP